MSEHDDKPDEKTVAPADVDPGTPGAEAGQGGSFDTPPGVPSEEDDSALGDSDQHSSANA